MAVPHYRDRSLKYVLNYRPDPFLSQPLLLCYLPHGRSNIAWECSRFSKMFFFDPISLFIYFLYVLEYLFSKANKANFCKEFCWIGVSVRYSLFRNTKDDRNKFPFKWKRGVHWNLHIFLTATRFWVTVKLNLVSFTNYF